jgi:exopolysaccharide production protein ExoZ
MFQRLIRSWSEPTRSAEIVGIQYLRGFAVIGVVLSHATTVVAFDKYFGGPAAFRGVLGWGGVGVELFYVISGFIIVAVSLRPETLEPRWTISEFIWRRFARIIPLMWLAVISYSCLHYLGRGSADLSPMLRTMVLWPIGQLEPIPLWSLRQEWLFYLLFSVAMLHTQRRTWVLVAWFISPAIVGLFRSEVASGSTLGWALWVFSNPTNVEFGFGFLIGLAYLKWRKALCTQSLGFGFAVTCLMSVAFLGLANLLKLDFSTTGKTLISASICSGILLVALRIAPEDGTFARIGRRIGDASYSIYLFHSGVLSALFGIWAKLAPHTQIELVSIVGGVVAIVSGVVIHHAVERPLVRFVQVAVHQPAREA